MKLEKNLSRTGIPLFATDEPAIIDGVNSTTVLVRRVKQGVAEWFRLQLKENCWKGLVEHALDGWNIGPAPYGYLADRRPHPVPVKASQGRTKTRLAKDPDRATVVEQIFTWRTVDKLGMPTIAARLNADPARYPAPTGKGWTTQTVFAVLGNPKYTGHMVYGRIRKRNGHRVTVPADQWLWSPEPVHPVIVDRPTWEAAQEIGAGHGTSRDGNSKNTHPATTRTYTYRGRIRCRDCRRRMGGIAYGRGRLNVYYQCPHSPSNPRHAAASPGHPRTVKAPETRLDEIVALFFNEHVFGPGRAGLLAAQLPATDATADRDVRAAALTAKLRQLDTAQNAQILALEQLSADPGLPADLKTRLFDAFDLQILWNKPGQQATVFAEITEATIQALPGILDPGRDGYDDTAEGANGEPAFGEDLFEAPIVPLNNPEARILPGKCRSPRTRV